MRARYVDPRYFTSASLFLNPCLFFLQNHRTGLYKLNSMVVPTLLSTVLHKMPRRLFTGARCLPFNSILQVRTDNLLSLIVALHSLMVSHYFIIHTFIRLTHPLFFYLGIVSSIVDNEPSNWPYGYVFGTALKINHKNSYRFHLLLLLVLTPIILT